MDIVSFSNLKVRSPSDEYTSIFGQHNKLYIDKLYLFINF